jgi:HEAT repeat protein
MPDAPPEDPAVVKAKVDKAMTDLDSGNPDVIYPAITVLSQYKVVEAVPKLSKLLWPDETQHKDVFTRQAAAAALGNIGSVDGVVVLINAIADRADMVSQQANRSFKLITNHDTELSPKARIQEKRKVVGATLEWWGRHEDEVRALRKQPK